MSLADLCDELALSTAQCKILEKSLPSLCGVPGKTKRARTAWQQCIAERRKGKPFDPEAIKELAKEYRAGRCP